MRRFPSFLALRAFEAAARGSSFTRAAGELNLTPSAISHQVHALEAHFGQPLFFRHGSRVVLTPDGVRLADQLASAFTLIEDACAAFARGPSTERLAVHCSPSFASKWLGPRLPEFMQICFPVTLRLSSGAEPIDLSRHEDLDVLISYGSALTGRGIVVESFGVEDIVALCTEEMAARCDMSSPSIAPLLIDSSVNPVRWPDWFAQNGLPLPPPVRRPSFDRGALAVSAAAQGLGIALESRWFALDELANGHLVELGSGRYRAVRREMHFLSYREIQKTSPPILAFRDWLRKSTLK